MENKKSKRFTLGVTSHISSQDKHQFMSDVKYLIVIFILITNSIIHPVKSSNIICSKAEYVRSGIEFKQCQDETLQSFQPSGEHVESKFKKRNKVTHFVPLLWWSRMYTDLISC